MYHVYVCKIQSQNTNIFVFFFIIQSLHFAILSLYLGIIIYLSLFLKKNLTFYHSEIILINFYNFSVNSDLTSHNCRSLYAQLDTLIKMETFLKIASLYLIIMGVPN